LRLLIGLLTWATFTLRHLERTAAERAMQAARTRNDPVMGGAATFARAHCRPSAALPRTLRGAAAAADCLES